MKRYLVFASHQYYPEGGWRDFQASYHNFDEAIKAAEEFLADPAWEHYDWAQVIDFVEGIVQWEKWRGDD